uniref:Activator of 90 kDa heat shock protein ATPase homolog 1 n=1 Tax=Cacopsylla melanoneura TaxID=428564 RepID=A0A8D8SUN4_9HEMI
MAKWGEGDPRWIVEERPDAKNVNNWHWTEKNANQWSKDKLKALFVDLEIQMKTAKVKLKEIEKCEGEAVINNRKGKLIFFYEWDITINWTGFASGNDTEVQGKINIPNLSEENSIDEVEVTITIEKNTTEGTHVKESLYSEGRSVIKEKLGNYVSSLKEEFSQGMILPKKDEAEDNGKCVKSITAGFNRQIGLEQESNSNKNEPINTTNLDFNLSFMCAAEQFYDALTNPDFVKVFTNGPVRMDAQKGGKFDMFGGNINGEFVELVPNKKIVKKWRNNSWKSGHYSTVTISIEQRSDHTQVIFKQTGIPEGEEESTRMNWNRYYWEALKRTFGFGLIL